MTLIELNRLPRYRAEEEFLKCCNSGAWARAMARRRPFLNFDRLLKASDEIWRGLDPADGREAGLRRFDQGIASAAQIQAAREEQIQITRLRLMKLVAASSVQ